MALTSVPFTFHLGTIIGEGAPRARVTVEPNAAMLDPGEAVILPKRYNFDADINGDSPALGSPEELHLLATDDPSVQPGGLAYRATIRLASGDGPVVVLYFNVHYSDTSFDLSDATPQPPAAATMAYASQAGLAAEEDARAAADTANASAITAETDRAITAEAALANDSTVVHKALYDANTILKADTDDTPAALTVPPATFLGRDLTGGIAALPASVAGGLLGIAASSATVDSRATWGVNAATYDAVNDRLTDKTGNGNHARLGSAVGADSADPLLLTYNSADGRYIRLTGVSGNYLSVADSAALSITGSQSGEIDVTLDDWTPSTTVTLASKYTSAGNQRSWRLDINTLGKLNLVLSADGAATTTATSSVATGAADGSRLVIRWTWRASDGRTQFFTATSQTGTFTQLGSDQTAAVGAVFDSTAVINVSGSSLGTVTPAAMSFYRLRLWSDITQTTLVLDIDTSDSTLVAPYASFTEQSTSLATVTINRSTSGRKTTVVSRTGLLFGTDDYAAVPDAPIVDFAAAGSFTAVAAFRFQGNPAANQALLAKKADLTTGAGYALYLDSSGRLNGIIADGTNSASVQSSALTSGALYVAALVRDVANDQIRLIVNGTATAPVTDTTTATLANAEELRLGRLGGAGTSYLDAFGFHWRVFSEALTAADMVTLQDELVLDTTVASVPVAGSYPATTSTVVSAGIIGESQPRLTFRSDGSMWTSDGSYAMVRSMFMSRNIGGTDTAGAERTFFGHEAGLNATLYKCTAFGYRAGKNATGRAWTAIGSHALENYLGNESVAIGVNCLANVTTGNFSTGIGGHTLEQLVSGHRHTGIGDEAASFVVSGSDGVAVGFYAASVDGSSGGLSGHNGMAPTAANRFTAIGNYSGYYGREDVDGVFNDWLAIGYHALINGSFAGAIGSGTTALAAGAWAIGTDSAGTAATTSTANEIKLGTALHTVNVIGNATVGGAAKTVGFYGSAGVAKQTGVPVTAAGIHAALVNLNLIAT